MSSHVIEVNNLTKIYNAKSSSKSVKALADFSLKIEKGNVFGLLGPNGAGKTTLVKILLGIVNATEGNCKMLGEDISNYHIKRKVGYLPENHKFPLYLTGEKVMEYYAKLSGYENDDLAKRITHLLTIVKMNEWRKTKVKKYSKGMMQRLGLAQALVADPELIFLDEPTDGVDPIGRKEIRDIILELKNEGKTIFLNSHLLSEVELVTDRVAIVNKGKLIREGTVDEITTAKESLIIKTENSIPDDILNSVTGEFSLLSSNGSEYEFRISEDSNSNALLDSLRNKGVIITSMVPKKHSLEDMFISLINSEEKK